jgi:hypothetical protein
MSLNYEGILSELQSTVQTFWEKACNEAHIPINSSVYIETTALENAKHYPQFNHGVIILVKATSEYKFFRYMQHTTVCDITNYLNSVKDELND